MKRPLLIGYGNCLREDDAVGWHAVERINTDADIVQCRQLTPELAPKIAQASIVVFFDAAIDQEPGSIHEARVSPDAFESWTHHVSPGQLLAMAKQLTGCMPAAFLITGGVRRIGWSECLSSEGETTAQAMADRAATLLNKSAAVDRRPAYPRSVSCPAESEE